jgi:MoaA/NifB/PqqE/SkfB family radical SAM enzyme
MLKRILSGSGNYARRAWLANVLREFSYIHGKTKNWGPPRIFEIETTNVCAAQCVMCPKKYNYRRPPQHMPFSLFQEIIDQLNPEYQVMDPEGKPLIHLFHYGEPCWYPHFEESIKACKARGLHVVVSDNAAQFSPEYSEKAIRAGLDELWLMLDGMDEHTSRAVRGSGASFHKGMANINYLLAEKKARNLPAPAVYIFMIRQPANHHQWGEFESYWKEVEGATARVAYFSTFGGDIPAINDIADELRGLQGQPEEDRRLAKLNQYRCYYPWHSVSILSDGKVVPCCRDYNGTYILGDLNEKSLVEIWNDRPLRILRKEIISGNIVNPLCSPCKEANNEIGLPGKFYPGLMIADKICPKRFYRNRV